MAIDLLQEYIDPRKGFVHTFSHDLESLIYVFAWVCVLYQAPNEVRRDKTIDQTCLRQWASAKTVNDIESLYDQKLGQLLSSRVADNVTPYFAPLKPFITRLYGLIRDSRDPDKNRPLTHVAVTAVLMDAFKTVEDVESCGAINAKRAFRHEPAAAPPDYCSEGRDIRRKVV
jgi:Fungal protein kinase